MFRFTLINHLCNDWSRCKDITRLPDRIRQDVSRSPGGDSRVFLNNCIGCHTGMDPLARRMPTTTTSTTTWRPRRQNGPTTTSWRDDPTRHPRRSKYFNNDNNFEHGFATPGRLLAELLAQLARTRCSAGTTLPRILGQRRQDHGLGTRSSDAFAQCQVEKVFENVCLHPVGRRDDRDQITAWSTSFQANGYNLKQVFAESAVYCMGDRAGGHEHERYSDTFDPAGLLPHFLLQGCGSGSGAPVGRIALTGTPNVSNYNGPPPVHGRRAGFQAGGVGQPGAQQPLRQLSQRVDRTRASSGQTTSISPTTPQTRWSI